MKLFESITSCIPIFQSVINKEPGAFTIILLDIEASQTPKEVSRKLSEGSINDFQD